MCSYGTITYTILDIIHDLPQDQSLICTIFIENLFLYLIYKFQLSKLGLGFGFY